MKEERLKGFILAKANNFHFYDLDSFIEKTEEHLEPVDLECDVSSAVDDLIEEGWLEYIEEGNNIKQVLPENQRKQQKLEA